MNSSKQIRGTFTVSLTPRADESSARHMIDYATVRIVPSKRYPRYASVQVLTGADNDTNFTTVCSLRDGYPIGTDYTLPMTPKVANVVFLVMARIEAGQTDIMQQDYAARSGRCCMCNRTLTRPDSLKRHMGADCAKKYG